MDRVNPLDLDDFAPKPKTSAAKIVKPAHIDRLAQDNGFPSRKAAAPAPTPTRQRRYTTGRNQQINVKATAETIARFTSLADQHRIPLGEMLARAVAAFELQNP